MFSADIFAADMRRSAEKWTSLRRGRERLRQRKAGSGVKQGRRFFPLKRGRRFGAVMMRHHRRGEGKPVAIA